MGPPAKPFEPKPVCNWDIFRAVLFRAVLPSFECVTYRRKLSPPVFLSENHQTQLDFRQRHKRPPPCRTPVLCIFLSFIFCLDNRLPSFLIYLLFFATFSGEYKDTFEEIARHARFTRRERRKDSLGETVSKTVVQVVNKTRHWDETRTRRQQMEQRSFFQFR